MSLLKAKSLPRESRQNVLGILINNRVKENIISRLELYWNKMGLPSYWIREIINILSTYHDDEEEAINNVRKKFPEIGDPKSEEYSIKLANFRKTKIKNITNRINNFIVGKSFVDLGGRVDDLAEEILMVNSSLDIVYVTDIGSFSERSNNPKINFIVQPSLTETPLIPGSIGSILVSMVLHHMDSLDQDKLIKHLVSLLELGGRLILIEDSYPDIPLDLPKSKNIKEYLDFSFEEKIAILHFYDWFGNRLMRNRDNIPLNYSYLTMEAWESKFKKAGLKKIKSIFIDSPSRNLDFFPPKAIMIFEKDKTFI